jgi:hypothetical protein
MKACTHGTPTFTWCYTCQDVASGTGTGKWPQDWESRYMWPPTQPKISAQRGWECPKCGHVYSPAVAMCLTCPGKVESSDSGNDPGPV